MTEVKRPRGRPPIPESERKSEFMAVKVTTAQKTAIDSAARASGIAASEIIRSGALREARRLARKQRESS